MLEDLWCALLGVVKRVSQESSRYLYAFCFVFMWVVPSWNLFLGVCPPNLHLDCEDFGLFLGRDTLNWLFRFSRRCPNV